MELTMQRCRSCGALVFWVQHSTTHKPMPIDVEPREDGNIAIMDEGYVVLFKAERARYSGHLYRSHFASCPHAKTWRNAGYHSGRKASRQP